ncbi:hypothetical protein N7539_001854 [Penicillium diatomitis]|uniref:SAM domain-containing protein n=1 Tax=Penicillium diatomitis TaxID=2819901 RepID=A0A9W9XHT0_9EURO|nr:uncharacterized protein N7539_001854 [Penicillium diatomitis]KAJ5493108.1 hypothetical protein N7539_001854 [Penicillium diatomitis]
MDGQRQYIPGPPPPQHPMNLPPPPPRHPHQQLQTGVPPPPPGPPPGPPLASGYGTPGGWQQTQQQQKPPSWGRPPLPGGFPPPPPPLPQNQHIAAYRPSAPLSLVTSHDNQPLTSATYIPGNDTLGVGIPPLFEPSGQTYDPYAQQRQTSSQTYHPGPDGPFNPQTPGTRLTPPFTLHNNIHELVTNDNPSQGPQHGDLAKSPTHRHQTSGASLGGMSPSEAAIQWPLDRVLLWLARNGFSKDWQETFKALELQGADFLELGLASGGRGNLGKMHKVVYPQLAKECARSGTGWDSTREREEGLRMRKLIRQIHENESDSSISTPMRGDPPGWATATVENGTGFYSSPR